MEIYILYIYIEREREREGIERVREINHVFHLQRTFSLFFKIALPVAFEEYATPASFQEKKWN